MTTLAIRDSRPDDLPAITAIYGHWVTHGLASFELTPPDTAEMAGRRAAILAAGYPHLVAERAGRVVGYSYASAYRPRPAYRYAVENSVYVAPGEGRGGTGRALLDALIERCTAQGFRLMVAVIGDFGECGLDRPACGGRLRPCRAVAGRRLEARALGGQRADDPPARTGCHHRAAGLTRRRNTLSCRQ